MMENKETIKCLQKIKKRRILQKQYKLLIVNGITNDFYLCYTVSSFPYI